ncbi:hypothetical protein EV644_14216 [Kribbella orskensis]|uniref:Carboxypeptidase family protein n=1 Tax=Kribbella orskensis TaxID=2512216 RepID=A0ABY2B9E1_9ACTN|nr:hypothetical protein EV642_14516 [Kribbella sp. VKM Ac-2500]TCO08984.1 hypothetical protein EV644_14216 [Kribbella orskensis]
MGHNSTQQQRIASIFAVSLLIAATVVAGCSERHAEPDTFSMPESSTTVGDDSADGYNSTTTTPPRIPPSSVPSPNVVTRTRPAPQPDDQAASDSTFSGLTIFADGEPAGQVTVEFKIVPSCPGICHQPHVDSDAQGRYSIQLSPGVYNAMCIVDVESDYECGPRGGDGGPFPVDVPPYGQHLDFVVCEFADYPSCLSD